MVRYVKSLFLIMLLEKQSPDTEVLRTTGMRSLSQHSLDGTTCIKLDLRTTPKECFFTKKNKDPLKDLTTRIYSLNICYKGSSKPGASSLKGMKQRKSVKQKAKSAENSASYTNTSD